MRLWGLGCWAWAALRSHWLTCHTPSLVPLSHFLQVAVVEVVQWLRLVVVVLPQQLRLWLVEILLQLVVVMRALRA